MHIIRHYINLVESAEDKIVYHAGTFSGGEYDPSKVGEPGDIRPLGKGIYAAKTKEHASRYLKYVTDSTVKIFKVSENARLYPWGNEAWQSVSSQEQQDWREKSAEVQKAFEKQGLVKKSRFNDTYGRWIDAVLFSPTENMRKFLVSLGVDGAFTHLPNDQVEYVFYNTNVLELIDQQSVDQ